MLTMYGTVTAYLIRYNQRFIIVLKNTNMDLRNWPKIEDVWML